MLDDLSGIQSAREIKPDKISPGLKRFREIERIVQARKAERKTFDKQKLISLLNESQLTLDDLQDYMFTWGPDDPRVGLDHNRNSIAGAFVSSLAKNKDPTHLNFYDHKFDCLLSSVSDVNELIIENAYADNLLPYLQQDKAKGYLVLANCTGKIFLNQVKNLETVFVVNCTGNGIAGTFTYDALDIENIIFINSRFNMSFITYELYGDIGCGIKIASDTGDDNLSRRCNQIYLDIDKAGFAVYTHVPSQGRIIEFTTAAKDDPLSQHLSRMYEIAREMEGKNGMQIYDMSKEITRILDEMRIRC